MLYVTSVISFTSITRTMKVQNPHLQASLMSSDCPLSGQEAQGMWEISLLGIASDTHLMTGGVWRVPEAQLGYGTLSLSFPHMKG